MNMSNVNEKENNDFEAKELKLSEFDLDKSSMIEASAGTGKTFTISNLVVRLLLEGTQRGNTKEPLDIENLLIVTFTNAAAADLRARVLEKIHECRIEFDLIKNGDRKISELDSPFREVAVHCIESYSSKAFDSEDTDNIKKIASVFSRLLIRAERNIDKASISTIHSFCNRALNQIYSFEAGRAFNVTLTQDISEERKEAMLSVWRSLFYKDSGIDRDLLLNLLSFNDPEHGELKGSADTLEKVRLIDHEKGYYGFSVRFYYQPDRKLQKTPDDRLRFLLGEYERCCSVMTEGLEKLRQYRGQIVSTLADGTKEPGILYTLSSGKLNGSSPYLSGRAGLVFLDAVESSIADDTTDVKNFICRLDTIKPTDLAKMSDPKNLHFVKVNKGAEFADPELEAFEFDAKELLRAYNDAKKPFETIKKELRILIALKVILKTDELCERDNVISNNEVLRQLSVALNCDRERGDVLASLLRKRYPVAMIDEFQDTDPVQFAVFSKLYLNQEAADEYAHCYFIGDPKQSIYAFRGTDINSYNKAKDLIKKYRGKFYTLNTNYRSSPNIIEGVNEIFKEVGDSSKENAMTEELSAENSSSSVFPYVKHPFDYFNDGVPLHTDSKIHFSEVGFSESLRNKKFYFENENSSAPVCNYVREISFESSKKPGKPSAKEYYSAIAEAVAHDVRRCLSEGRIEDKGEVREVRPSDITILVNSARENGYIQEALKKQSVQSVYFSDRESVLNCEGEYGTVNTTEEATNIIYLMEAMCDSTNFPKVNRLLASSLLRLSSDEFLDSIRTDKFDREITLLRTCRDSWEKYGFICAFTQYVNEHELLKTILETDSGERALSNYFQIAEIIQSVNSKVTGSSAQLLWFRELALNNKGDLSEDDVKKRLESEQSLVKVMTVHKSKGLEFPIVFTPFESGYMSLRKSEGIYYDPELRQVTLCLDEEQKFGERTVKNLTEIASLQEKERLLYVALTRAKLANFICFPQCVSLTGKTVAEPLRQIISVNLTAQGNDGDKKDTDSKSKLKNENTGASEQTVSEIPLKAVADTELFTKLNGYEDLEYEKSTVQKPHVYEVSSLDTGSVDNSFTVTSYSAITSGAHNDMFASLSDEKQTEVEDDSDVSDPHEQDLINFTFARGSAAGSFLHKLMEIVLSKDEVVKTDRDSLYEFVNAQLKYDFYHLVSKPGDDGELHNRKIVALSYWLYDVLNAKLLPEGKGGGQVMLSDLCASDSARELDYFLPCRDFRVNVLNEICHDFYKSEISSYKLASVPDLPDLKKSNFKGFMNGSLDLVARFDTIEGSKFFMVDYKSNYLGNSFSRYTQENILKSVFESRYDVQILFYSLALYRFLKNTVHNFSYEKDFGGVIYLYLRGMNSSDTVSPGQFYVKPSEKIIQRLSSLFDGETSDTGSDNSGEGKKTKETGEE